MSTFRSIIYVTCVVLLAHFPLKSCFLLGKSYKVTNQVFLDISIDDKPIGTITIGLFGEIAPKTAKNFYKIATTGINNRTYAGSRFHRVIARFMIQGGDILHGNGSGSISIYGEHFDDENFTVSHSGPGYVSMANNGKNKNGCQFFITTMPTSWLDGKHVVFGKVVSGQNIVHIVEHERTDGDDVPLKPIVITRSGRVATKAPFFIEENNYDLLWAWTKASIIPLAFTGVILSFFYWVIRKLTTAETSIEEILRKKDE